MKTIIPELLSSLLSQTCRVPFGLLLVLSCLMGCSSPPDPVAVNGVLDLRSVDLGQGSVKLKGQWQVLLETLLSSVSEKQGFLATLPGTWKSFFEAIPQRSPKYATFKLTLLLDTNTVKELAIASTEQSSAYVLWVNGEKLLVNGRPASSYANEIEEIRYRQSSIKVKSPRVELILQASTFHMDYGGKIFRFRAATKERMDTEYLRGIVPHLFAMGVLLIFAVQYLLFLAPMTRDGSYFRFGLFCLCWLAFGIFAPCQYTFSSVWFDGTSFRLLMILTFLATMLSTVMVGLYCQELFPNKVQGYSNRAFAVVIAVCIVALPLIPFLWMFKLANVVIVLGYVEMTLLSFSLGLALYHRVKGARIFAVGFGIFVVAAARDGLILAGLIDASYGMLLGGAALAVSEAFALSQKFLRTHQDNLALLTEVQAKNEELGRLSRIKDDFLANTSHELRTPLHGILGLTQSILQDARFSLAGEVRRTLEMVVGSATRLTRLVNDILDFSKLRNRDLELHKAPVALQGLVPVVLAHFAQAVQDKEVVLQSELPQDLPNVLADEDRLMQILFNLVGNAVKYTDRGTVCIAAHRTENGVEIWVRDTGIGIASDQLRNIFEPFEQVAGQTRGGTGLGLSITSKLVELHGAQLQVESTPAQGSCFGFCLPVADANGQEGTAGITPELDARRIAPWANVAHETEIVTLPKPLVSDLVILAIDDEPVNLAIVRSFLKARGMEVVTAPDGVQAMELIAKHQPSVVLLDVMMPHLDGYEVCGRIREKYDAMELPILFLSARSRIEDVVHGFTVGGNDYVLKPFLGQELVARVEVQARQRNAFLALLENRSLKEDLAEMVLEKAQIETVRSRLLGLFHGLSDPILVVDYQWEIRFVNQAMAQLLGFELDVLQDMAVEELLLDPAPLLTTVSSERLPLRMQKRNGTGLEVQLRLSGFEADDENLWALVAETDAPPESAHRSQEVLQTLEKGEARLARLRLAMEALTAEMQESLPNAQLQGVANESVLSQESPRETREKLVLACEVMNQALELWTAVTGKSKADFAQESGLWKVQLDGNGWRRTATLDKYLDLQRIPRLPKMRTIHKSVDFVAQVAQGHPRLVDLQTKANQLMAMV